ncbi:unnamed protein product [Pleuronectes platessa]|uniref:Uncharacterized protein n=1 Tax=Pleuronectes platessa TaxID=8262 RepID=A0A9N7UE59_PLEPL|nr:unnamed protein product [Pleuronectes platessa]
MSETGVPLHGLGTPPTIISPVPGRDGPAPPLALARKLTRANALHPLPGETAPMEPGRMSKKRKLDIRDFFRSQRVTDSGETGGDRGGETGGDRGGEDREGETGGEDREGETGGEDREGDRGGDAVEDEGEAREGEAGGDGREAGKSQETDPNGESSRESAKDRELLKHSGHLMLGIDQHQEEHRAHCTSVTSDNRSEDTTYSSQETICYDMECEAALICEEKGAPVMDLPILVFSCECQSSCMVPGWYLLHALEIVLGDTSNLFATTHGCVILEELDLCNLIGLQAEQVLVQALVIPRLDHCNSLLAGLPASAI